MTESTLTPKQAYFLKRLQEAEQSGQTVARLAQQEQVSAASLYNYRHKLRRKGHLPPAASRTAAHPSGTESAFEPIALSSVTPAVAPIELKTQLANGQPVWMTLPASQLSAALAALST